MVDNGSSGGSAQLDVDFPQTQFIRLPKNFGLTKAMNIGWRAADAEYVFFLHEDTGARLAAVLGPLASFRWGELRYTLSGQKIDGTQP